MSTTSTTLKLPDELKRRIAALVEGTGKTPHAFMVEALEAQTRQAELRQAFVREAGEALDEMDRTGRGYAAKEVHAHMRARVAGQRTPRPKAKAWRK